MASAGCLAGFIKYFAKQESENPEDPFCETLITQTFIGALPSLTQELNLEVAKTWQVEILEKIDTRKLCGIHLGTNSARIRVPVTYRFHLRIRDSWHLSVKGRNVIVYAPAIRPSLPPDRKST